MNVTITPNETKITAALEGRLDTAAAPKFSTDIAPLMEQADKAIVLDCTQLQYISSSGLRLFLCLRKATLAKGGSVTIKGASADIKQVFAITGFNTLFQFED